MAHTGPEFYDQDDIFATYMTGRQTRRDSPNDTLEKPIFDELVGNLADLRILDLGCGDARFGLEALQQGCRAYVGVDGSQNMIELARKKLAGTAAEIVPVTLEAWDDPSRQFDLVTSRLALHYIQDIHPLFEKIYRSLEATGRLIFSVEHPVITSCNRSLPDGGQRQDWIVDDYFETGPRLTNWMGGQVVKYHRTVEDYFIALRQTGFVVDAVRESRPQRARFSNEATYERRKRIPLLLFFAARPAPVENRHD